MCGNLGAWSDVEGVQQCEGPPSVIWRVFSYVEGYYEQCRRLS